MSRKRLAALVLALALPALAACGSEDKDGETAPVPRAAESAQGSEEPEGQGESFAVELVREGAIRAAAALREEAESLESADAPALLRAAGDRLAEELRTLADRLEREAENVDAGDVDRLLDALRAAGFELPGAATP